MPKNLEGVDANKYFEALSKKEDQKLQTVDPQIIKSFEEDMKKGIHRSRGKSNAAQIAASSLKDRSV